jgi:hypothetical protein
MSAKEYSGCRLAQEVLMWVFTYNQDLILGQARVAIRTLFGKEIDDKLYELYGGDSTEGGNNESRTA